MNEALHGAERRRRVAMGPSSLMGSVVVCLLLMIAPAARAASNDASGVHREGFTIELGLGGALTVVDPNYVGSSCPPGASNCASGSEAKTFGGLAPLSLGIGGFLSPTVALLFRLSGTSYFRSSSQIVNAVYGPAVQVWLTDRFMLGAGAGVGLHGPNPLLNESSMSTQAGFAFSARAGYALYAGQNHSFRLAAEVVPGFYESATVIGTALNLEFQWL